jgi:hypothetical protein
MVGYLFREYCTRDHHAFCREQRAFNTDLYPPLREQLEGGIGVLDVDMNRPTKTSPEDQARQIIRHVGHTDDALRLPNAKAVAEQVALTSEQYISLHAQLLSDHTRHITPAEVSLVPGVPMHTLFTCTPSPPPPNLPTAVRHRGCADLTCKYGEGPVCLSCIGWQGGLKGGQNRVPSGPRLCYLVNRQHHDRHRCWQIIPPAPAPGCAPAAVPLACCFSCCKKSLSSSSCN